MRNNTNPITGAFASFGMFRILLTALAAVILIALAGVACGDAEETPAATGQPTAAQTDDADEHADDADEHTDDADEHTDDADDHADDADDHDGMDMDSDDDPEANAHLEAEPKDALFLVNMSLFSYTPNVMEAKVGDVIEIAIQNSEAVLHDFTIDKIDADIHISYLGGTGQHEHEEAAKEADVHFALTEPGSGIVHLKINEPGEYVFYCSVPGHQELGMEGTLIVTEA